MIKHIPGFFFLLLVKTNQAYLPFPECIEDPKGCDPCDPDNIQSHCNGNEEPNEGFKFDYQADPGLIKHLIIYFIWCIITGAIVIYISENVEKPQIDNRKNKLVVDEWKNLRKKLHYRQINISCYFAWFFPPPMGFFLVLTLDPKIKLDAEKKLQENVRQKPIGSWEEHQNLNLMKKGGGGAVMMVHNWRESYWNIDHGKWDVSRTLQHVRLSETPIEELKRIVEQNEYSAITIYEDFDHAVIRKFDQNLTAYDCEYANGYNCTTFIYKGKHSQA